MSSSSWVIVVGAVAVLLGLARLWRSAEARAETLVGEVERLSEERADLVTRLSRDSAKQKKQADELAELRKRAEKTHKRQAKGAPDMPLGTAARIRDLEEQIVRVESERDRSRTEREALAAQVAQLEARAQVATRAESRPAPATPNAEDEAAPSSKSGGPSGVEAIEAQLAESRARIAQLAAELSDARETEARLRKRVTNQEQLYASLRAELDVKKDRLRTQEEQIQRLQALKAAIAG